MPHGGPLVSVVIPCLNAAPWLGEAIESCLQQTWRQLEIIVVDNGSTDESLSIARRYGEAAVSVLKCRRPGASAARNLGLSRAHGDFIQFLDADDVLDRDKIRLQLQRLAVAPNCVSSGAWARFRDSTTEACFRPEPVWRDCAPDEFLITAWLGGFMMAPFAWLTPRPVAELAGPWNEELSLNDDGEYFARVVLASTAVMFCEGAKGYYRTLPRVSLSRRRDALALRSGFHACELSCARLLQSSGSALARKACATAYRRFAFDAYPAVPDLVKLADGRARELGGCDLQPGGGRLFEGVSSIFGWRLARRLQVFKARLTGTTWRGRDRIAMR